MTVIDTSYWTDLAAAACRHAGINPYTIEPIATWDQPYCANAVYHIGGQRVLKLSGPTAERQFFIERTVLATLAAHSAIPAPRIVAAAERSSLPPYLILSEVPGETAEELWDGLSRPTQLALARELGALTAAIHRLPQDELAAVERRFAGKELHIEQYQARWIAAFEQETALSSQQQREIAHFLRDEAPQHLAAPVRLTHYDLAHNHIYLAKENGAWRVTAIIDWAEAVLGPPEWDIVYLWFWTFTRDREAMYACLETLLAGSALPAHFARRCLAAIFHTSSMRLLWPHFLARGAAAGSVVEQLTAFLFPPELFGPPR
jgi:aminoglycoside phosphotransferase (APT) family kinase protein